MAFRAAWREAVDDADRRASRTPEPPTIVTVFIETFVRENSTLSVHEAPRQAFHGAIAAGLGHLWATHVEVRVGAIVRAAAEQDRRERSEWLASHQEAFR